MIFAERFKQVTSLYAVVKMIDNHYYFIKKKYGYLLL